MKNFHCFFKWPAVWGREGVISRNPLRSTPETQPNKNKTKQHRFRPGGGAREIPLRSSSETCHQTKAKHATHAKTAKNNIETQLKHNAKQTPIKAGGGRAKVGTKAPPKTTKQKQNRHRSSQGGGGVQTLTAGRATKTNKIAHQRSLQNQFQNFTSMRCIPFVCRSPIASNTELVEDVGAKRYKPRK